MFLATFKRANIFENRQHLKKINYCNNSRNSFCICAIASRR